MEKSQCLGAANDQKQEFRWTIAVDKCDIPPTEWCVDNALISGGGVDDEWCGGPTQGECGDPNDGYKFPTNCVPSKAPTFFSNDMPKCALASTIKIKCFCKAEDCSSGQPSSKNPLKKLENFDNSVVLDLGRVA